MNILKVSSKSSPNMVAGALAGSIREDGKVQLQAVGAGAINQAVKAIAIARGFLLSAEIDLIVIPSFTEVEIDGEKRTAMRFDAEPR